MVFLNSFISQDVYTITHPTDIASICSNPDAMVALVHSSRLFCVPASHQDRQVVEVLGATRHGQPIPILATLWALWLDCHPTNRTQLYEFDIRILYGDIFQEFL